MMTLLHETFRRTPLYDAHVKAGARMVPFAGWEMPLHYGSQLEEHLATRRAVSIFDVSHMGQIFIEGAEARALAQAIVTRDLAPLRDGEVAYSVICREDGGLIDDLMVTRLGAERFLLVVNAAMYEGDVAFMQTVAWRLALPGASLKPCAEDWAMVAVQGPAWAEACAAALGRGEWLDLPPFRGLELDWRGQSLIVSTTGYTGERGVEILCPPASALELWNALTGAGARPAGLAARDTLRLEKGYALSGQDFTVANNPFEAGLGWVVDLDKEIEFSGREALRCTHAEGVRRRFVGLLPEGRRIPRHGTRVLVGGQVAGEVTSGGFAPSLGRPVALGYVDGAYAGTGERVELDLITAKLPATVTRRVFYPPGEKA